MPEPTEDLTPSKRWEMAHIMIHREGDLINHRLTWFFLLQGFLFSTFAVGVSYLSLDKGFDYQVITFFMLALITGTGALSPWFIARNIKAATNHANKINFEWDE